MNRDMEHPRESLSAYLDGELDAASRAAVEAHLQACSACAALLSDLQAIDEAAAREAAPPLPAGLAEGIVARIAGDTARKRPAGAPWRLKMRVPLAAAAGLAAVGLLSWLWLAAPAPPRNQDLTAVAPPPAVRAPGQPAREAPQAAPQAAPPAARNEPPMAAKPAPPASVQAEKSSPLEKSEPSVQPAPVEAKNVPGGEAASSDRLAFTAPRAAAKPAAEPAAPKVEVVQKRADDLAKSRSLRAGQLARFLPREKDSLVLKTSSYEIELSEGGRMTLQAGSYACTVERPVERPEAGGQAVALADVAAIFSAARAAASSGAGQGSPPTLVLLQGGAEDAASRASRTIADPAVADRLRALAGRYRQAMTKACGAPPDVSDSPRTGDPVN